MLSASGYACLIVIGYMFYVALGGKPSKESNTGRDYEKETYEYFSGLSLEDQDRYYRENLDLMFFRDDLELGFTNDKYVNAKHAAEIARVIGKSFTDKYKTY